MGFVADIFRVQVNGWGMKKEGGDVHSHSIQTLQSSVTAQVIPSHDLFFSVHGMETR